MVLTVALQVALVAAIFVWAVIEVAAMTTRKRPAPFMIGPDHIATVMNNLHKPMWRTRR